jgi:predicted NUDIX family NTP pyrophosphohydrolase
MEAEVLLELEPPPTSGTESEVPEVEELGREGWIRMHEAVLKYGVPLATLLRLAREGRIQALFGSDGALYVLEKEVERVAEWWRSQGATAPPQ